jgi:NAD(P)-dependent dehydrogenase (short-subunit alcohol dehydrogenase family)
MSRGLFDLKGRVVLATGANSGIGLGFLQGCAKQGADVVVWGRRSDRNAAAVSGFMEGASKEQAEGIVRHFSSVTPLGRVGDISDIEGPAAYLASDASKVHTGDVLVIDGGCIIRAP